MDVLPASENETFSEVKFLEFSSVYRLVLIIYITASSDNGQVPYDRKERLIFFTYISTMSDRLKN
jgi:hypothetical protein